MRDSKGQLAAILKSKHRDGMILTKAWNIFVGANKGCSAELLVGFFDKCNKSDSTSNEATLDMLWSCPRCTFDNSSTALVCGACCLER